MRCDAMRCDAMRCDALLQGSPTFSLSMVRCLNRAFVKVTRLPEFATGRDDCPHQGTLRLHLRIFFVCSHVGCCDSSSGHHATHQANASGHPIIRSLRPGEDWRWRYMDRVGMMIDGSGSTRIPPSRLRP
jgi:hypothetical protein